MLRKVRLNQTEKFALDVVTHKVALMVTSMIDGRPHAQSIGSEQGGIAAWDDIVIHNENNIREHYQVKQQTSDFCDDSCTKETGKKDTPLDSAMISLASWLNNNDPQTSTPRRAFKIILPEGPVKIKKEFTVNQFERLCNKDTTSLTNLEGFENLISTDGPTRNIASWLKTWCGCSSNEHMLKMILNTQVIITGNSIAIQSQTKELLSRYYRDSEEVFKKIQSFAQDQSTFTSQITPRAALHELATFQLPEAKKWTQYQLDSSDNWAISGTHNTEGNDIDFPNKTVPHLWNSESKGELKFDARLHQSDLGNAILRLAFHMQNLSTAHFNHHAGWLEHAKKLVGGTLGSDESDMLQTNLTSSTSAHSSTEIRSLDSGSKIAKEYNDLTIEMDNVLWEKVSLLITQRIRQLPGGELQNEMESRWSSWRIILESSPDRRKKLIQSMLTTAAEGSDIVVEIRMGIKNANVIRDGVFLLLVVSVAMDDTDKGWEILGDQLSVNVCSIKHWSGPAGSPRRVRKITDDGIDKLLGQESAKVLILPNVEASPNQVIEQSMADSKGKHNTLASPHHPSVLFTNDMRLRRMIEAGDLQNLRKQIRDDVQRTLKATLSSDI